MVKLGEFCGSSVNLRCQLPTGDLETLISIRSDDRLRRDVRRSYLRRRPAIDSQSFLLWSFVRLQEKKLVAEIKRTAKTGNEGAAKILAHQLIRLRQQIANLQGSGAQMRGIATHTQAMHAHSSVVVGMTGATKAMAAMNKVALLLIWVADIRKHVKNLEFGKGHEYKAVHVTDFYFLSLPLALYRMY